MSNGKSASVMESPPRVRADSPLKRRLQNQSLLVARIISTP